MNSTRTAITMYRQHSTFNPNGEQSSSHNIQGTQEPALHRLHASNSPIFMQPLLPPQNTQPAAPHAQPLAGPSTHPVAADFYAQPPSFQLPLPAAQLQQLAEHPPYGSGDADDGYTLDFPSLDDFLRWRAELEDRETVEFNKADAHHSKADPPRFKEHVKLTCARRHPNNSRNRYIKKCPERNRNIPSRKIEGEGCQASISYKTYYETPAVRAMYVSQHSHPIGPENLPFTRRGRKLAEQERKLHQQIGFSRANPVPNGTSFAASAANTDSFSKHREARNMAHTLHNEPPPMARLEPPITVSESEGVAIKREHHAQQHPIFAQGPPQEHHQTMQQTFPTLQSAMQVPPPSYYSSPPFDQNYTNAHPVSSETAFPVTPYQGNEGHDRESSSRSYLQNPNGDLAHPQPSYLASQMEIQKNYQSQHLPTPTTPSAQIPNSSPLQSRPRLQSNSDTGSRYANQLQSLPSQGFEISQISPVSPIMPFAHTPTGVSADFRPNTASQLPDQNGVTPNQDRWDRLESLFHAVRDRARNQVLHEPAISKLESLLSLLYSEGNLQGRPRSQFIHVSREQAPHQHQMAGGQTGTEQYHTSEGLTTMSTYAPPLNAHTGVLGMPDTFHCSTRGPDPP